MQRPKPTVGLRHIALYVSKLNECVHFYTELLGMKIIWQPDNDNIYLTTGDDNLALHKASADFTPAPHQRLDHLGFFLSTRKEVDEWHAYLQGQGVRIQAAPKDHRDGTRSFYCADPDGNSVQMIYYPLDENIKTK